MKINIKRDKKVYTYEADSNSKILLNILIEIKKNIDSTLTFNYGCKSGVCGSCAIRVNGEELLACQYEARHNDLIEPLKNYEVKRDLVVDKSINLKLLKRVKATIHNYSKKILNSKDEKLNLTQSDCILCGCCYSACPALLENYNFLGPFALTRAYKYIIDKREESNEILENLKIDGVYDCTLCSSCTDVCPKHIDPKSDILELIKLMD